MRFSVLYSALFHSTFLVTASAIPVTPDGSSDVVATRGIALASESQYCNDKVSDLFRDNAAANAADAIVATVLCIGTVAMYHSGIGGGGFALVKKDSQFKAVDFRPTAPSSATDDYYNKYDTHRGGAASGVPAELRGLWEIHQYGKLPWEKLFQPAINAASGDFQANDDTMYFIEQVIYDPPFDSKPFQYPDCGFLGNYPWNITFCPLGKLIKKGDPLLRLNYAKTLQTIAAAGDPSVFYEGEIATHIIETLRSEHSLMTKDDLKNYQVIIRDPVSVKYNDYTATSVPVPSSGTVVLSMLKILERFFGNFNPGLDELSTHRLIETMRFGYAQRSRLGDPDKKFNPDIDISEYQKWLLNGTNGFPPKVVIPDQAYRDPQSYLIGYPGTSQVLLASPPNNTVKYSGGTSHVVALDNNGLAITLTTSVGEYFGGRVMDPTTGIIFDDVMSDFQRVKDDDPLKFHNNHIIGGKRPLSGMSPTIVTDKEGHVLLVTGSAGGKRIPSATLQSIVNVINRKMSATEALSAPRLHDQLSPNITEFDLSLTNDMRMYDKHVVRRMRDRNHRFTWVETGGSSAQAIKWEPNQVPEPSGEEWQANSGGCRWWGGVKNCPFKPPKS